MEVTPGLMYTEVLWCFMCVPCLVSGTRIQTQLSFGISVFLNGIFFYVQKTSEGRQPHGVKVRSDEGQAAMDGLWGRRPKLQCFCRPATVDGLISKLK